MRKTTRGKGFAGAVVITVLTVVLMLLLTGVLLTDCSSGLFGGPLLTGLILFCAFLYLSIAAGVVAALYQRWKEIKGGEEDEARKY